MKSALFCIASPLQAICAIEAMKFYNISEYRFVVLDHGNRTKQIESYLSFLHIDYIKEPYHPSNSESIKRVLHVFDSNKTKYDVLFMGDYRLISAKLKYLPLLKKRGKIIYLDDGNYILAFSRGELKTKYSEKIRETIFNCAARLRKISVNNFFTIYADDITAPQLSIEKNELQSLANLFTSHQDVIFFIGTATDDYCSYLGIQKELFLEKLKTVLSELKIANPTSSVLYFPHGRDNNVDIQNMCKDLNIDYIQSEWCVELYSLINQIYPKAIYGFTSTALYTFKILYPEAFNCNLFLNDGNNVPANDVYLKIADTYGKKGIVTRKI